MPKQKGGKLLAALRREQQTKAKKDARQRSLDQVKQTELKKHQKISQKLAKRRSLFPYTPKDSILLIGEGNFSYAHSIAQTLGTATNIVATAYDSEETVKTKYSEDAEAHIAAFKALGGIVLFDIDGTQLGGAKDTVFAGKRKFTHIVFNFPHVGAGIKDQERNIRINQTMMVGFFRSAQSFLSVPADARRLLPAGTAKPDRAIPGSGDPLDSDSEDDGKPSKQRKRHPDTIKEGAFEFEGHKATIVYMDSETDGEQSDEEKAVKQGPETAPDFDRPGQIHVSLKTGLPYSQWNIRHLAKECGLACQTSWPFDINLFPGYQHRRTLGFKAGLSRDENAEIRSKDPRTHVFVVKLNDSDEEQEAAVDQKSRKTPVSTGGKRKAVVGVNAESYDLTKKRRR
ncbi:hypothetical protein LPJ59_000531 [Coemansia sp. RSA 2399]|nr:hypothetical protein LPJ59_000531 [Coemansia sp. RSA 2399]KAJ1907863.1 hypothetical protein LPJ81_000475 [Coemansia sp. IMI 209127]